MVQYQVSVVGSTANSLSLSLRDQEGKVVAAGDGPVGELKVLNPNLWWPYLMHENPGYLYTLEVKWHFLLWVGVFNRVKALPYGPCSVLSSHGPCACDQSGSAN